MDERIKTQTSYWQSGRRSKKMGKNDKISEEVEEKQFIKKVFNSVSG